MVWSTLPVALPTSDTILAIVKTMLKNDIAGTVVLAVISELEDMAEVERVREQERQQEAGRWQQFVLKEQISG